MKRIVAMLALVACAVLGAAQTQWVAFPDSFNLSAASTRQPLRTLFFEDGEGMTLLPMKQQGPVQEMGLELIGHNAVGVRPYTMTFTMGDAVAPGAILGRRVEFFNYATNSWEVVLRTKANGQGPDGLLTWTEVTVKAGTFVNAKTGEFRTRVYWNSVGQLSPVWIDQAGWVMTSHWRG